MDDHYEMTPKKQLNKVTLAAAIMVVAVVAVSLLMELAAKKIKPGLMDADWFSWAVTAVSVVGIGLPVLYLTLRKIPGPEHKEVVKLGFTKFITIFFISVAAMYITNMIGTLVNMGIASLKGNNIINPAYEAIKSSNFILTFIYGVMIAPVAEEILYRKLLLDKLRRFGDVPAALLSGFAFGLFHMNLAQFFYATTLGIIFAYVALKTNTIRYTIMLHIMINFIGISLTPFILKAKVNLTIIFLIGLWVLIALPLGITFFILNIKNIHLDKAAEPLKKVSDYILNPGTIVYSVICIAMMVYVIII